MKHRRAFWSRSDSWSSSKYRAWSWSGSGSLSGSESYVNSK
jgi:hypothetical protein